MYAIYGDIWVILMVNVAIYGIHTDPMGMVIILKFSNAMFQLLMHFFVKAWSAF